MIALRYGRRRLKLRRVLYERFPPVSAVETRDAVLHILLWTVIYTLVHCAVFILTPQCSVYVQSGIIQHIYTYIYYVDDRRVKFYGHIANLLVNATTTADNNNDTLHIGQIMI